MNLFAKLICAPSVCAALFLGMATSAQAQDPLSLPVVGVAVVDTLSVDTRGIRGMSITRSGAWLLTSDHRGRAVPEMSYSSSLLSWNPANGEVQTLLTERDSFHSGLAFDGEAFWLGGNSIGGLEAIYRVQRGNWKPDETVPSSGYHAGGLAWADEYLWQVDSSARQISRLETEEGKLSRRLQPPGYYPTGLAHDGVSLYCADASTGMVYRIRANSGRADGILDPDQLNVAGEFVTLAWGSNYLWVARDSDNFVVRYQIMR